MGLFVRKPSKPDAEPPGALEVIRRIKVTIDRYWVTSERQVDASPDSFVEPTPEARDIDEEKD
jgi:hypothetical protein